MTRAGFIGLGNQGAGMALIEQGVPTTLWARREQSPEVFVGHPRGLATGRAR